MTLNSSHQNQHSLNFATTSKFSYLGRNLSDLSLSENSSTAFSDCNSDRSGEFTTTSTTTTRNHLALSCATSDNISDDFIQHLITQLNSPNVDVQKQAALEIRLLAKHRSENRIRIAKLGAIRPLIALITSGDLQVQEYGVTAILNLSLCDENKDVIVCCGAIKGLIRALKVGTATAKENAACALLRLSQVEENKGLIGRSGAIPPLVHLLEFGGVRGKKDASTALYSLCSIKENKIRAIEAGIVKPLVELMADFGSGMVDKAAYVLSLVVEVVEAKSALVEDGGIPVMVELIEVGSQRQKEIVTGILLHVCQESGAYRSMVAREGGIPPLVALSQSSTTTTRAKKKAETLIELLRQPRSMNSATRDT